ncbi:hypothetical protein ACLOJK_034642 [Asimina triloba]
MDGGRIWVVAGERLDSVVGVLLVAGGGWWLEVVAMGSAGAGSRIYCGRRTRAAAGSRSSGGRDGGVRSGRGRRTVAGSPALVVAGLGNMMEHHTGAPCSSGVPYMVYLQM